MSLPTDYQDDVLDTTQNIRRIYNIKRRSDNTPVAEGVYLEDITAYIQNGSSFASADVNRICAFINLLCTKRVYQVPSSLWVANTDASTNTKYPYKATVVTEDFTDDSTPVWQMGGLGDLPTEAEDDAIETVAEAIFASTGVTLYAEGNVTVTLNLEVMGV